MRKNNKVYGLEFIVDSLTKKKERCSDVDFENTLPAPAIVSKSTSRDLSEKNNPSTGFTLAEVLITLGIIGVVAALTMPALMADYQKKVLITRIKKFYSVLTQAVKMNEIENGELDPFGNATPEKIEEIYNIHYAPYLKTTSAKKGDSGMIIAFPDGSGMYMWSSPNGIYITWCVDYKACNTYSGWNARNKFLFFRHGEPETDISNCNDERACVLYGCRNYGTTCARILRMDGWEIKDDYPW